MYFQIVISLLAYVATFSGQFYFWRSYFFTLFQSNYFDITVTFSEQLFLQNSCFLLRSTFFRTVIFSQLFFQNSFFFRAKILQSSHSLRIGSFLGQLLFGTTIFLAEELFRIKISTEELIFQSRYFSTASPFSGKLHKANISEKQYSALPTFSGELPFQSGHVFKRCRLLQHSFQKSCFFTTYYFTATLPFHS